MEGPAPPPTSPVDLEREKIFLFLDSEGKSASTVSVTRAAITTLLQSAVDAGVDPGDEAALKAFLDATSATPESHAGRGAATIRKYLTAKAKGGRHAEEQLLLRAFRAWIEGHAVYSRSKATHLCNARNVFDVIFAHKLPWLDGADSARLLTTKPEHKVLFSSAQLSVLRKFAEFFSRPQQAMREEETRSPLKRPRGGEPSRSPASSSAASLTVGVCMGQRYNTATDLPERFQSYFDTSFFAGLDGRYLVRPTAEEMVTMAVGIILRGERTSPEEAAKRSLLVGVQAERHKTHLHTRRELVGLFGQADAEFKTAMQSALAAVRIRAHAICRMFGVQDESRWQRLDEEAHRVVVLVTPHALMKTGTSAALCVAVGLVGLLTGHPFKAGVVLTGDLSLSGRVMRVGEVPHKIAGAKYWKMDTLVCPQVVLDEMEEEEAKHQPSTAARHESQQETLTEEAKIESSESNEGPAGPRDKKKEREQQEEAAAEVEQEERSLEVRGASRLEEALAIAFGVDLPPTPEGEAEEEEEDFVCLGMMGGGRPTRLALNNGAYHGACQSMTWLNDHRVIGGGVGKAVHVLAIEVECVLQPGATDVTVLGTTEGDVFSVPLCMGAEAAILWLSKYQHELQPRGGKFLLENFGEKIKDLDVVFKVNPSGPMTETHWGAAYLTALISAVTGYKANRQAGVVATVTVDGWLSPMANVNELDVFVMLQSQLEVIVVPRRNLEEINRLRDAAVCRGIGPGVRFVGEDHICGVLPHALRDYPAPQEQQQPL